MKRKPNNNLILYLILNVLVSAATTLAVIWIWDTLRPKLPTQVIQAAIQGETLATATPQAVARPTSTPAGNSGIEVVNLIGAGDVQQEVIKLQRTGDGDLSMTGWRIENGKGAVYHFPSSPELILFKGGAVQVFTRSGTDTATEVYWNLGEPAWASGDTLSIFDAQGVLRTTYTVP